VTVSCSGPSLEMKICYEPHEMVNFTNGWIMATQENNDFDPDCVGITVQNGTSTTQWCDAGRQALVLDMTAADSQYKCGIQYATSVCIRFQLLLPP